MVGERVELVFDAGAAVVDAKRLSEVTQGQVSVTEPQVAVENLGNTHAATWPRDNRWLSVRTEMEMHRRSSSTERLIPKVHLADEEAGGIVRVGCKYG